MMVRRVTRIAGRGALDSDGVICEQGRSLGGNGGSRGGTVKKS
jgi:hypothetical protein